MKQSKIYDLVLMSVFVTIILLMTFIPNIGYITLVPGVSLTLVHIPVLIGIMILKPKYALSLGVIFGLSSMIASYMLAVNPVDLAFRNPLVSVLPRALFGIIAWLIFYGFKKLTNVKYSSEILFGIVALVSVFALYYGVLALVNTYNPNHANPVSISAPIALSLIVLVLTGYYILIKKQQDKMLPVPATFIVATLIHTILVVSALMIFAPELKDILGDDILSLIYTMVAGNGLLEALLAVLVGTPIYVALQKVESSKL